MGHHSCCNNQKVRRGLWSPEEDEKLVNYISTNGHGCWNSVPRLAGLKRCGKSCRLRWINYLRPDLKRGSFSPQEESLIIELHRVLGNRWARIAKHLPGRTDNEVKNFWNSSIKKKLISQGAADLAVPDSSTRIASNEDSHSLNANPNPMVPSQDHIFLPSTTSMVHALGNEDRKMDVINYNLDWVGAPKSLGTSAYDPTRSFDHHHQDRNYQHHHQHLQVDYQCPSMYVNETAPPYHTHAKFLDAKFILPQDPQVVAPLTATLRLDEIVEGGEYAMPSSSMTHEVNPCARVPFFPFGSYPYDPHVTMDYMDAVTASSSSSCGHFQVDYQCPSMYVNETVPAHHTQAKFLDAKFMLPQDLSAVAPLTAMPRLYENVEGGKCAMPSSSMTHEVDQYSRFPFGFYTYDPHVTMDVVMASSSSSSSSSCGHFQVDNQYPSIYVNETAPPYHTQTKFLDAKLMLPQDPQAVVPLTATPRLSKIIEGGECAMSSSSITHEVDPCARVPCLPFGSCPYDLHMTMD